MENDIIKTFSINNDEFEELLDEYGKLANWQSWRLIKHNTKNNHTEDFDDVNQEQLIALIKAGAYYKRQIYIESCLSILKRHIKDPFLRLIVDNLSFLWFDSSNKYKFGVYQEELLEKLIQNIPEEKKPKKNKRLKIDAEFANYCKAITWNRQKALGKKITKEKAIRCGTVSISEFSECF